MVCDGNAAPCESQMNLSRFLILVEWRLSRIPQRLWGGDGWSGCTKEQQKWTRNLLMSLNTCHLFLIWIYHEYIMFMLCLTRASKCFAFTVREYWKWLKNPLPALQSNTQYQTLFIFHPRLVMNHLWIHGTMGEGRSVSWITNNGLD